MTDPRPKGTDTAIVYVSAGWWVARCCASYCEHAEFFGVATNGAGAGGLTPTHMLCGACGAAWPARWPAETLRRGVEQILGDRPDPRTRNWYPHETLADLVAENFEHGIAPADALAALASGESRTGALLATVGDEITVGGRQLAPGRLAIPGGP